MSPLRMDALDKAFDLIHTSYALEVLLALGEDRDPYDGIADPALITAAIALLRDLGAAATEPRPLDDSVHVAAITTRGRTLLRRLIEIEQSIDPHSLPSST